MLSEPHDARAIDLLRLDVIHYARLYRDTYAMAMTAFARAESLERQLQQTREELARYSRERVA